MCFALIAPTQLGKFQRAKNSFANCLQLSCVGQARHLSFSTSHIASEVSMIISQTVCLPRQYDFERLIWDSPEAKNLQKCWIIIITYSGACSVSLASSVQCTDGLLKWGIQNCLTSMWRTAFHWHYKICGIWCLALKFLAQLMPIILHNDLKVEAQQIVNNFEWLERK